ncbi:MAG: ABC transporter permease [Candidatus Bipolaricaulota bacterium]
MSGVRNLWRNERAVAGLVILLIFVLAIPFVGGEYVLQLMLIGFAAMVPIGLAAGGELVNERAGLFNIGIEGIMLLSALGSAYAAGMAGTWWLGLIVGAGVGTVLGLLFGLLATYGKVNQIIAGVGINMIALGAVGYWLVAVWGTPGFHVVPRALRLPRISTPAFSFSPFIVFAVLAPLVVDFVLRRSRFGLRAKAAGYNPFVTDVSGIDVFKLRTAACAFGGAMAGLAGSYMTIDWLGIVSYDVVAGRGFIAIACVVFGGLDPILTLQAAYLFGLLSALSMWMQNIPWAAPLMRSGGNYLFLMLPYLSVIAILLAFPRREALSKMIGVPYRRE